MESIYCISEPGVQAILFASSTVETYGPCNKTELWNQELGPKISR